MRVNDRLKLWLVIGGAGLVILLLATGLVLFVQPPLAAIDLQPVLIGVEDMDAGLYGTEYQPGPADLSEAYPAFASLPRAENGAKVSLTGQDKSSGSAWIWLHRDRRAGNQLYEIFNADRAAGTVENSDITTSESGEIERIGERAVYSSIRINAALLGLKTELHSVTLQRCAAVVTIRMVDTDFASVIAYARRLDARLQRDVCGWRR